MEAPAMKPATLDGIRGTGIVTILRDADGEVVEANGTFRPADTGGTLDELRGAVAQGRLVLYRGTIIDPAAGDGPHGDVRVEVAVTGVARYRDIEGGERIYVNFVHLDA